MIRQIISLTISIAIITVCNAQTVQVNSDGTHTVFYNYDNPSTLITPEGTHNIVFHQGNTSTQVNPDGQQSTKINSRTGLENAYAQSIYVENPYKDVSLQKNNDTVVENQRVQSGSEFNKITTLLEQEAIDSNDYRILLLRIFNNIYDYSNNTADQIADLKHSFDLDSITMEEYILRKDILIYGKKTE
jgi:hypothetical protein